MKKIFSLAFALIIILTIFMACSQEKVIPQASVVLGVYKKEISETSAQPQVALSEGNKFVFIYSVFSSYLPVGTFEIKGNELILNTDDGKNSYVFEVKNTTLVFDQSKSSPVSFGEVGSGDVFILNK